MPERTGMDLHEELTGTLPDLAARMIFLTGGAATPKAQEFLERLPNAYLEKPVELGVLRQAIRQKLGNSPA
jgi:DNA-binding NarL/FixJ family response regulator